MWHHELAKVYQVRQNLWAIDEIGKTTLYVYEGEKRVLLLDTGFGLLPLREMVESLCPGGGTSSLPGRRILPGRG